MGPECKCDEGKLPFVDFNFLFRESLRKSISVYL
jgi:hypothetical protein